MKKRYLMLLLIVMTVCLPAKKADAQLVLAEIIAQAITKVIRAVDLRIQRLQNKTIWLQNAQKTLENEMSKLKLTEIKDWVERQRKLYADYFDELWRVKTALAIYNRVRGIVQRQVQIVGEYKAAWDLFRRDKQFTPEEIEAMLQVYTGILRQSARNIDGLFLVINSFATQMSDAGRLDIINRVADAVEANLMDLKRYNEQNKLIAVQRATAKGEIDYLRKLYGL
jgi:hypothetical protein